MGRPRFLLHAFPVPGEVAPLAERAEDDGWDGLLLADSQNLVGDPYVELALAAAVTSRIELGPFVTNPVTRHPAVTAGAVATLQVESSGRAVLGIGRGDSSLSAIGRRRATVEELGAHVRQVQGYLAGEAVEEGGRRSQLRWVVANGQPKVPVDLVATGRRMIELAATVADRVTFALGASPDRLRWAVEVAAAARELAGRPPAALALGACVVAATAPDPAEARDAVRANVAILARFGGQAAAADAVPDDPARPVEQQVAAAYDADRHGLSSAAQSALVPDDFVDEFAVVGSPARCAGRLAALAALGLDHLVVIGPSRDVAKDRASALTTRFATEVLPRLR